jgi:tetratricopeptide (TPR) repeat protein
MRLAWAMAALLLLCGPLSGAQDGSAGRMYSRGLEAEGQKSYRKAVVYYEAASLAEPKNPQIQRHLGNCRYYLGEKAKALIAYDAYLAMQPGDKALRAFAEGLRPHPTPVVTPMPRLEPEKLKKKAFQLRPAEGTGWVLLSGWPRGIWRNYNLYVVDAKGPTRRKLNPEPISCDLVEVTGLALHQEYLFHMVYVVNGVDTSETLPLTVKATEAGPSKKGN